MDIRYDQETGLVPAIIQDVDTGTVLMLGYMNKEAVALTESTGYVTFWSRSRSELWTKGATSGHMLLYRTMSLDCDGDALLVKATPTGPVCHTGADTCWTDSNTQVGYSMLSKLETIIQERKCSASADSYTAQLLQSGINKVAQKVGEEAVELIIEAKDDNRELFLGEAADLLFHYLVLLAAKDLSLGDVLDVLDRRHRK